MNCLFTIAYGRFTSTHDDNAVKATRIKNNFDGRGFDIAGLYTRRFLTDRYGSRKRLSAKRRQVMADSEMWKRFVIAVMILAASVGGCAKKHHFVETKRDGILLDTETGVECYIRPRRMEKPEYEAKEAELDAAIQKAFRDQEQTLDAFNAYESAFGREHPQWYNMPGDQAAKTPAGIALAKDPQHIDLQNKMNDATDKVDDLTHERDAVFRKSMAEMIPDSHFPVCKDIR
jgi:hypothetical protein